MRANELELLRSNGVEPCLLMDTGEATGRIPFVEAALALRPGVNLLINSDFRKPVNQKGLTEYTTAGYTIDRMWIGDAAGLSVGNGYITIKSGTYWQRRLERNLLKSLFGKIVTGSILLFDGTLLTGTTQIPNDFPATVQNYFFFNRTHGTDFYLRIFPDGNNVSSAFAGNTIADVDMIAIKVEFGSQQTLAHQDAAGNWVLNDPPPDKALELLKCQKYQYKNTNGSTEFIRASAVVADAIYFDIPVPVPMRATPVISNPENIELVDFKSRVTLTGFSIGVSNHEGATIRINAVKQNHGVTDAYLKATAVLFDANL